MKQHLQQRTGMTVGLSPTLQEGLKLLQMTNLDLNHFLQQELQENPFLDLEFHEDFLSLPSGTESSLDFDDSMPYQKKNNNDDDNHQQWIENIPCIDSIYHNIFSDIEILFHQESDKKIAYLLLNHLNEFGLLDLPLSDIIPLYNIVPEQAHQVLKKLQTLDPAGIFSENLIDSMKEQLNRQDLLNQDMVNLLTHMDTFIEGDLKNVLKDCQIDMSQLKTLIQQLKSIVPYPLLSSEETIKTVIPDLICTFQNNEIQVTFNPITLPSIILNKGYYNEIKNLKMRSDEQDFVKSKYQRASWLTRTMEQRYETILKIAKSVMACQASFIKHGPQSLAPLTLNTIAQELEVHESTISRVISNKYIQTSWGTFCLKYFFSKSIKGAFLDYSAKSVQYKIIEMIKTESRDAPLSDEDISQKLQQVGIDISRRTVAKYRDICKIPSSSQRKRLKILSIHD